jgi:hypothetical protein
MAVSGCCVAGVSFQSSEWDCWNLGTKKPAVKRAERGSGGLEGSTTVAVEFSLFEYLVPVLLVIVAGFEIVVSDSAATCYCVEFMKEVCGHCLAGKVAGLPTAYFAFDGRVVAVVHVAGFSFCVDVAATFGALIRMYSVVFFLVVEYRFAAHYDLP